MDILDYRVTWVHGVGHATAGYSIQWEHAFNSYLFFPDLDYIEVLWSPVFTNMVRLLGLNAPIVPLTPHEQVLEDDLRRSLTTMMLAHTVAQRPAGSPLLGEWSSLTGVKAANQGGFPPWVVNPDAYIGEFVQYLVSRRIRNAIKEKMKEKLRPLVGSGDDISIIAHSWGTVVAYECLLDLEVELPTLKVRNLFTLGSPLWLVQQLLDDRSGRKPSNTATWVNIHAQGDVVASWLRPGFLVDKDFAVASFGGGDPHDSYFAIGNVAVQRDIVAATILAPH